MMQKLTLYVSGESNSSQRAIENLQKILTRVRPDTCEVEIVDVLASPKQAIEKNILATPTLIRESPPPSRRVIGDLADMERVLIGLDLMWAPPRAS